MNSETVGFDCVYNFAIRVPVQKCYDVRVDQQPVGRYPADSGGGVDVGVILAESVYGDPATGEKPSLYADFDGMC